MKLLTIVIPSYNTESFIDKNMQSFLDERLYDKVEILIINDGSKDRTAEIASKYEETYKGYIRLIDKENGGHGSVINRGIREAQGKYFKVIDADDWVNTDNLVQLVMGLQEMDADLVINPYIKIDQQTRAEKLCSYKSFQGIQNGHAMEALLDKDIGITLHSATFKTSIFRDNGIMVTEKCYYEDFQYVLFPIPYIKTATVLDYPVYWYLVGQKTQSVDAANALKNIEMSYRVFCDALEFYDQRKTDFTQTVDRFFGARICTFLRSMYNIYLRNPHTPGVLMRMLEMDKKIERASPEFHQMVGEKYAYVRIMRKGNRIAFYLLSGAFALRKRIVG